MSWFVNMYQPNTVLVNYGQVGTRFNDVHLADSESTAHVDSKFCKKRGLIGAARWQSSEAQLWLQWRLPTDIWSLGTMVCP